MISLTILVGASDETWSLGKGHEDQDTGAYLPLLSSHQGKITQNLHMQSFFMIRFLYGFCKEAL